MQIRSAKVELGADLLRAYHTHREREIVRERDGKELSLLAVSNFHLSLR